ncbi:MAG: 4-hydroxy-3-methylbut-2-enyl diphosphate reductase, partial [Akkermansia sp.]|nr:4-hydroxy-3-methylbut-2-enyl diphosphate reductase [Akkermansia sp.]
MKNANKPINVRRPEVMEKVQADVAQYRSTLVESIIASGNEYTHGNFKISLASAFGFCDGVKRAIEIAYATCHLF